MNNNNIQLENGDYVAVFKKSDHGRAGHIQFKNMKHKTSTGEIYDIQFNNDDEKVTDETKKNIPLFFSSLLGQFGGGKKKMTRRKLKKQKRRRKSSTQKNT